MGQEGQCNSPVAVDSIKIPGLRQGSKLHHILQQQGDLEQLPAWLQDSTTSHSPKHLFPASPTLFSHQLMQQHLTTDITASTIKEGAASNETIADLSMALAALQETILQIGAATHTVAVCAGIQSSTPRKRLRFDADVLGGSTELLKQQQTASVQDELQAPQPVQLGQMELQN